MDVSQHSVYDTCPLLTTRSIRLLRIDPPGLSFPRLACTLESFDIDQAPLYVALSYTWGDSTFIFNEQDDRSKDTETAQFWLINEYRTELSTNLHDALVTLRDLEQFHYLWVDAICINQFDSKEKAQQVQLMCNVYGNAKEVQVWLGKAAEAYIADMIWLHSVFLIQLREAFGDDILTSSNGLTLNLAMLIANGVEDPGPRALAFQDFYTRRWFSRLWVVQVALATSCRFLYGHHYFHYHDVYELINFHSHCDAALLVYLAPNLHSKTDIHTILNTNLPKAQPFDGGISMRAMEHLRRKIEVERLHHRFRFSTSALADHSKEYHDLFELAALLRHLQCQDPRDNIYSFLGVLEALHPDRQGHPVALPVDYDIDPELLFYLATSKMLLSMPSLNFLSFIEDYSCRSLTHLPSWVPDFSAPSHKMDFCITRQFDAAGSCNIRKFTQNRQLLIVASQLISHVKWLDAWDIVEKQYRQCGVLDLLSFYGSMSTEYVTGESRIEALWKTLNTTDNTDAVTTTSFSFRGYFREYILMRLANNLVAKIAQELLKISSDFACVPDSILAYFFTLIQEILHEFDNQYLLLRDMSDAYPDEVPSLEDIHHRARMLLELQTAPQQLTDLTDLTDLLHVTTDFVQNATDRDLQFWGALDLKGTNGTEGRRLFMCQTGHIGLGPGSMRLGDQVHVPHNCGIPMILRPCGSFLDRNSNVLEAFRVVGEAYVHGLMFCKEHSQAFCDSYTEIALL